ncbi:hypothetical protein AS594_22755 [Streptomyces agglomeratus]|uniref:Uncharacterized protein n=1 Tax=Streptomyces agglomeratus TaxID=285458 RepID=A0A1E5PBF9_9ACTN|nr:hypothetical protein AS594_22755 [Streptomyces agglomeratus]
MRDSGCGLRLLGVVGRNRGRSPVCSYAASMSMRRWWRSSPEYGVARKISTNFVASSWVCMRPPMEMTLASLCSRPSAAVCSLQASAARTPLTLFAAICSPLPEPPITMPRLSGSAAVFSAARRQNGG